MVSQKHSKWLYLVADCWASPKNLRIKLEVSKCMSLHGCQKLWLPSGIAVGSKCQINRRGWSWTQTWTLHPDQQAVKVLSQLLTSLKSLNKQSGVWILCRSVEDAEIKASKKNISKLKPHCPGLEIDALKLLCSWHFKSSFEVRPLPHLQMLQNSGCWIFMLKVKPFQSEIPTD